MIKIKGIAAKNAAEITTLSQQLGYTLSEQQTLQNIYALKRSKQHKIFIAIDEKKVVGWIGLSFNISLESLPLCEIHGLIVHEQYRGRGIGRLLVEEAKKWSRNKKVNELRLRCNIKRTEAHLFYQKIGFTEVKQQKVFEISL